jgi:hypothetical protein
VLAEERSGTPAGKAGVVQQQTEGEYGTLHSVYFGKNLSNVALKKVIPSELLIPANVQKVAGTKEMGEHYVVKEPLTKKQREADPNYYAKANTVAYNILNKFLKFDNTTKSKQEIKSFYNQIQKAYVEDRITNNFTRTNQGNREAVSLVKQASEAVTKLIQEVNRAGADSGTLQINERTKKSGKDLLEKIKIRPSVQRIKRYIKLSGQDSEAVGDSDQKLLKQIEKDLRSSNIQFDDPYIKTVQRLRAKLLNNTAPYEMLEFDSVNHQQLKGPPASGKSKITGSPGSAPGIVSAKQFTDQHFDSHPVPAKFRKLISELPKGANWMIYGSPKQGKTSFTVQLAKELSKIAPVLYDFAEQKLSSTTKSLLQTLQADKCEELYLAEITNLEELEQAIGSGYFSFVVIDLIRELQVRPEEFRAFMERHPGVSFILVFSSNKDGSFKGTQDWAHDTDCIVEVSDFVAEASGRLGAGKYNIWKTSKG